MPRPRYTYRVVTHNGAGVYGGEYRSLPKAREAALQLARREAPILERIGYVDEFEIERSLEVHPHSFRYWMRQGKRWVLWDPHRDVDDRKPDFVIRVGRRADTDATAKAAAIAAINAKEDTDATP